MKMLRSVGIGAVLLGVLVSAAAAQTTMKLGAEDRQLIQDIEDRIQNLQSRTPSALVSDAVPAVIKDVSGVAIDYAAPITESSATEAVTAANNNECMAANAPAKDRTIANPPTGSMMRVQFGNTISATDYRELIAPGETWAANTPSGVWRGVISCQWLTAVGDAAIINQAQ